MSAKRSDRFDVGYEVLLPEEMAKGSVEDGVSLLLEQDMSGSVRQIHTVANLMRNERGMETNSLSSYMELAHPLAPNWVATDVAGRMNEAGFRVSLPHSKHAPALGIGLVWDEARTGPVSAFHASEGGLLWGLNTVLERKGVAHQSKVEDANELLAHHVLVLSGLASVIFDINHVPLGEQQPRRLLLEAPAKPLELGPGWNKGDGFEAFAGIDDIIEELRDFVSTANLTRLELLEHGIVPAQALMLYGTSGTGKTRLLRTISRELGVQDPINVSFGDVSAENVGAWASRIDTIFAEAYKRPGRTVILMDEIDGLIKNGNPDSARNINNVLKKQLEEIQEHPHVFFLSATNDYDAIDPVVRADKRIPLKLHISPPNDSERVQMLRLMLVDEPLQRISFDDAHLVAEVVSVYDFNMLAGAFDGFSAGDMRAVLADIGRRRLLQAKRTGTEMSRGPTQAEIIAGVQRARRTRS